MSEQEKKEAIVTEGKVEETKVEVKQSWFRRNKKKILIGGAIGTGIMTLAGLLLKLAKRGQTDEDTDETDDSVEE